MTAGRSGPAHFGPRLIVEADGGARGNPGPAGYGAVVRDAASGKLLAERAGSLGRTTNNVAEYAGLLAGLRAATELDPSAVTVRMDSKLVVEQMSGRWRVNQPHLQALAREAAALVRELPTVTFEWIPRSRNGHADRLANEAMDAAAAGREWQPKSAVDNPAEPAAGGAVPGMPTPGWSTVTSTPTRMLLLRHAATQYSVERRLCGRSDPPLTDLGHVQAQAATNRLARYPDVAAVISAPLTRAQQTAQPAADRLGVKLVVEDDLTETDFGGWDGLTFAQVQQRWPSEVNRWLASEDVAPPAGESFAAVDRRVRRVQDRLITAYPSQTLLLVSHVTPIKLLLRMALDAGPSVLFRFHLDPAGLSIVDWYADGPASVRLVNDTSHLP